MLPLLVAIVCSLFTSVLVVNYVYPDSAQASSASDLAAAQGADLAAAPAATSTSTVRPQSAGWRAAGHRRRS